MIIDSHCHLDFPDFADDLDIIVQRAHDAGVMKMVSICTWVSRLDPILKIAETYDSVYASVGTHPHNADHEIDVTAEQLIRLSQHPKIVAIGEAGLDYHYQSSTAINQANSFRRHIQAARETQLPLVIHSRDADDDMIDILTEEMGKGAFPAILHCFSSGERLAQIGVELGLYISFSGILTFKNSQNIRDIAKTVPLDRLLVETDAPYLAPTPYRGKRNEPAYTRHTAEVLAQCHDISLDEISTITTQNFHRLFTKVPQ